MWVSEYFILFSIFIDCIGVTLVNEIIQVSGAQFCNTLSVHCVVCSPPQVRSPSVTIYSPSPPLPPPSPLPGNHHTVVCVHLGSSGGGFLFYSIIQINSFLWVFTFAVPFPGIIFSPDINKACSFTSWRSLIKNLLSYFYPGFSTKN